MAGSTRNIQNKSDAGKASHVERSGADALSLLGVMQVLRERGLLHLDSPLNNMATAQPLAAASHTNWKHGFFFLCGSTRRQVILKLRHTLPIFGNYWRCHILSVQSLSLATLSRNRKTAHCTHRSDIRKCLEARRYFGLFGFFTLKLKSSPPQLTV